MKSHILLLAMRPIGLILSIKSSTAFVSQPSCTGQHKPGGHLQLSFVDDGGNSNARKSQECKMEMSSIAGADAIAKINLEERTKRAMLAEAVEDRIFELVDELDEVVTVNDGFLVGDVREEAVELAKQAKALQLQYDDLVSGSPSTLLDVEDNL
mmetsp:Transcript_23358/g.45168  ORF Transcript_23358/g.45168 Transcript_23358/m.45168 type:complete len:154 (+) Transcript_23358:10-471(+)|eukprot:CAMPEP_0171413792 /NCGR_PEP_ID=MMETSP0880-20121228/35825_1 /TAXON_ID=67004 /ORGANISM="Thalassiosira weissflogii, Strain CCMP1336" /LENGTH=153 /DNA_ID=CAMNT_0011931547 /DNA_START=9 /DNA_END=470 /DNA_ORIENTATION=+